MNNSSGGKTNDVFLSFRVEDTRRSFVSHLSAALRHRSIRVFGDIDLLPEGRTGGLARTFRAAIKDSKVSVVVFSENYACSKLCLEELVEILKWQRNDGQIVIPVFYRVSPSDVKQQTGRIATAFESYEKSHLAHRVPTWRAALKETSAIAGHESQVEPSDAELVETIVKDVLQKLFFADGNQLVGIDSRVLEIQDMLCEQPWGIRSIGIWGMGGIGKTTIAQSTFERMSGDFEASYFVKSFDKRIREEGLNALREDYFKKVLGEHFDIRRFNTERSLIKGRLCSKRVFLVLDDVHNSMNAEALVGGFDWFGPGSIMIITSRDKRVFFQCQVHRIYEAQGLNKKEAKLLLSRRVFGKDKPGKDFQVPSMKVIEYAKGNPFALEFFAKKLKRKRLTKWKASFLKLKQHRLGYPIMDKLKRSYDVLSLNEKNIFLDLACFFTGEDVDHVIQLLDGCGFFAHFGINVLLKTSLITILERRVEMHNLIQSMGREIVNRESVNPKRRSRLWDPSIIENVLRRAVGTEDIEGIFLDASNSSFDIKPMAFESMYNLRLLKIYYSRSGNRSGIHLPEGLASLPYELRLLHWENYPLNFLPQDFDSSNLVELNMPYSQLQKLWEGNKKNLEMLKTLKLCHSQQLIEVVRLSEAHNLEHIDLQGCKSLLASPVTRQLEHLQVLNLSGCPQIESFPEVPENIKALYLEGTGISEIPASVELLSNLVKLDLGNCKRLKNFPRKIYKLKSLELLNLTGCQRLESFPEISEVMENLRCLYLSETSIKYLPSSISNLIALEELRLTNCRNLLKLPDSLRKLKSLQVLFFNRNYEPSSSMYRGQANGDLSFCRFRSLLFLASTPYSLLDRNLQNRRKLKIPKGIFDVAGFLDPSGNDGLKKLLDPSIHKFLKLKYLKLRNGEKAQSFPDALETKDIISWWHIFTNTSKIDQDLLKEVFAKLLTRMWHLEQQHLLESCLPPSLAIGLPTSIHPNWIALVSPGSSAFLHLPQSSRKINSTAFTFYIVLGIQEDCYNPFGFSIRCICKSRTASGICITFETIFPCWSENEDEHEIHQDQMLIFYDCSMQHRLVHGLRGAEITFEFYPVDGNNKLLTGFEVTNCAAYMLTAQNKKDRVVLTTQRSDSRSDPVEEVEIYENLGRDNNEEQQPPRKRRRSA